MYDFASFTLFCLICVFFASPYFDHDVLGLCTMLHKYTGRLCRWDPSGNHGHSTRTCKDRSHLEDP